MLAIPADNGFLSAGKSAQALDPQLTSLCDLSSAAVFRPARGVRRAAREEVRADFEDDSAGDDAVRASAGTRFQVDDCQLPPGVDEQPTKGLCAAVLASFCCFSVLCIMFGFLQPCHLSVPKFKCPSFAESSRCYGTSALECPTV